MAADVVHNPLSFALRVNAQTENDLKTISNTVAVGDFTFGDVLFQDGVEFSVDAVDPDSDSATHDLTITAVDGFPRST